MANYPYDRILSSEFGIHALNPLQETMLESAEKHSDLLLLSPTGSGKTLAFLLPLLQSMEPEAETQACILCPTRELALQTSGVLKKLKTGLRVITLYGGHSFESEQQSLTVIPQIIVATPGRLQDHIRRSELEVSSVNTVIVDEFDKMLELGFENQVNDLLAEMQPKRLWLASATNPGTRLPGRNFHSLDFLTGESTPDLAYFAVECRAKDKLFALADMLCSLPSGPTIIFCNHREMVDKVSDFLVNEGIPAVAYHGGMEQDEREKALIRFRNGSTYHLVSTDLGARGLDIDAIQHIVHYQLPDVEDAFIHRNGRSARKQLSGEVFWLLDEADKSPDYLPEHGTFVPDAEAPLPDQPPFETIYFGGGKKDKISKGDVVGFLVSNSDLRANEIGMIVSQDRATFVAIPKTEVIDTLKAVWDKKIKGKRVKIARAK